MAVEHELRSDGDTRPTEPGATAAPARTAAPATPVTRATVVWYALVAAVLFGWFLFGWLVLRQGFVNSVGESAGTAFALLLAVSIVGTLRQSRRR